jgi:hypothetical protein
MECPTDAGFDRGQRPLAVLVGLTEDMITARSGSALTTPPIPPVGRLRAGQQPN